jgi:hypothetical protein
MECSLVFRFYFLKIGIKYLLSGITLNFAGMASSRFIVQRLADLRVVIDLSLIPISFHERLDQPPVDDQISKKQDY